MLNKFFSLSKENATVESYQDSWWWRLLQILYLIAIVTSIILFFVLGGWGAYGSFGNALVEFLIFLLVVAIGAFAIRAAVYYVIEGFSKSFRFSLTILIALVLVGAASFLAVYLIEKENTKSTSPPSSLPSLEMNNPDLEANY